MAVGELTVALAGGHDDLGRVDDDDVVAGVEVRGEDHPMLASEHTCNLGREPAED